MIETSNSQEPVESTAVETASPTETTQETKTPETPAAEPTLREQMEAKAKEAAAKPAAATTAPGVVPAGTPATPAYQPNFKYKAFGKEKDLPEAFRSLIKDPETEKSVKDVFTRADAFDDMKSRHDNTSKEFQNVLQTHQALDKDVKRVMGFRNNGDFDNFFAALKISDNDIFNWAQQKLNAMKDPAQLQQYQSAAQQRAAMIEQQDNFTNLQQSYSNQAVQARTMQLDMALNRPEVSRYVQAWDSANQTPGAFRNFVAEEARRIWHESRAAGKPRDVSPEEAIQSVIQRFGRFLNVGDTAGQPSQAVQQPSNRQAPPVIPMIAGQAASPIKKVPKNLDDIRKLAKEMQ